MSSSAPAAAPTLQSTTTQPPRLEGLDAARVFATLAVIWFHCADSDVMHPSGVLGRFSVSFYTVAAMVFLVESARRKLRPWPTYAADRFRRLYFPFIGWAILSALTLYTLHALDPSVELPIININVLIDGGTIHLWYISFLLIASVLIYPLVQWMLHSKPREYLVAIGCAAFALSLDLGLWDFIHINPHAPVTGRLLESSALRWSGIYWGIAIAVLWGNFLKTSPTQLRWLLAALGAFTLLILTIYMWDHGVLERLKILGGIGLLFAALAPWNNPLTRFLAPFGRMSAGAYFAHMTAIQLAHSAIKSAGGFSLDWVRDLVVFGGAVLLSYTLIKLFSLTPGLKFLSAYDAFIPKKANSRNLIPKT